MSLFPKQSAAKRKTARCRELCGRKAAIAGN